MFGKVGRAEIADRSGAALDGRDGHPAAAPSTSGRWSTTRAGTRRRAGLRQGRRCTCSGPRRSPRPGTSSSQKMNARAPAPRLDERVDDADQDARRHAHDGRAHAGRHQGLRRRPRVDRDGRAPSSRRRCAACPARAACSTSARSVASTSTSCPNREALARYGLQIDDLNDVVSSGDRRRARHDDRRRAAPLHGQRALQGGLPEHPREAARRARARCARARTGRRVLRSASSPTCAWSRGRRCCATRRVCSSATSTSTSSRRATSAATSTTRRRRSSGAQARGQVRLAPGHVPALDRPVRAPRRDARAHEDPRSRSRCSSIAVLLYLQFKHLTEVLIVLLSIPFALVGSVWLLYLLDYRISTAVLVGIIALVGLAAQTGVVMIVYIDHAFIRRLRAGKIRRPRTTSSTRTPRAPCSACARS